MTDLELRELQKKDRDRKRLQMAKNKNTTLRTILTPVVSPYRCPQTFGKALSKSIRALPTSPRKKVAVVEGLAKKVGITLANKIENNMSSNHGKDYSQVTEFFFHPDIVYTCPGMKDSMCAVSYTHLDVYKRQSH